MTRLVETVDRQVGGLPRRQRADSLQAQHLGAAGGAPADHVLHRRVGGPLFAGAAGEVGPRELPAAGACHEPGGVGLLQHVAGFVRRRPVDREGNGRARLLQRLYRGDSAAQASVALRAMRDTGSRASELGDVRVAQLDEVGEPHVGPEPVDTCDELDRAAAMPGVRDLLVDHRL